MAGSIDPGGPPQAPDELTLPFLQDVLVQSRAIPHPEDLASFRFSRLSADLGRQSTLARISLDYSEVGARGPRSLMAKFPSMFDSNPERALRAGAYANEVRFYTEIAKRLSVAAPNCYYDHFDPEDETFLLITSDVPHFWPRSWDNWPHPEHLALALEAIAPVHAKWWNSPDLQGFNREQAIVGEQSFQDFEQSFPETVDRLAAKKQEKNLPQSMLDLCHALLRNWRDVMGAMEARQTLCHRDFHPQNLLFDRENDPTSVTIIDWAGIGIGPAAFDLGKLMIGGLPREARRTYETALLRQYIGALQRAGLSDYSFDQCFEDYRRISLHIFRFLVSVNANLQVESSAGHDLFALVLFRVFEAVNDLEATEFFTS